MGLLLFWNLGSGEQISCRGDGDVWAGGKVVCRVDKVLQEGGGDGEFG